MQETPEHAVWRNAEILTVAADDRCDHHWNLSDQQQGVIWEHKHIYFTSYFT
jgi:hypothetical protein